MRMLVQKDPCSETVQSRLFLENELQGRQSEFSFLGISFHLKMKLGDNTLNNEALIS